VDQLALRTPSTNLIVVLSLTLHATHFVLLKPILVEHWFLNNVVVHVDIRISYIECLQAPENGQEARAQVC
jgi:hypothetical protein